MATYINRLDIMAPFFDLSLSALNDGLTDCGVVTISQRPVNRLNVVGEWPHCGSNCPSSSDGNIKHV